MLLAHQKLSLPPSWRSWRRGRPVPGGLLQEGPRPRREPLLGARAAASGAERSAGSDWEKSAGLVSLRVLLARLPGGSAGLVGWTVRLVPPPGGSGRSTKQLGQHRDADQPLGSVVEVLDVSEGGTGGAASGGTAQAEEGRGRLSSGRQYLLRVVGQGRCMLPAPHQRPAAGQPAGKEAGRRFPQVELLGPEEHLVPLVPQLLPGGIPSRRTLLLDPPPGLLDLGRRKMLLQALAAQLMPLLKEQQEADTKQQQKQVGAPGSGATAHARRLRMPTRSALLEAGRPDLLALIRAAGGFSAAAASLGLAAAGRRPAGWWEEPSHLEAELVAFVAAAWWGLPAPEEEAEEPPSPSPSPAGPPGGRRLYYYNQVSGRSSSTKPALPPGLALQEDGSRDVEGDGSWWGEGAGTAVSLDRRDRVMPTQTMVRAAGRYDLHHAIVRNGGYRGVAELLGFRPGWPRPNPAAASTASLRAELRQFVQAQAQGREKSESASSGRPSSVLPPAAALLQGGRHDLYAAVQQLGGWHSAASALQLSSQRRAAGHWRDLGAVVSALGAFMAEDSEAGRAARLQGRLPTQAELRSQGRHDLVYALACHGSTKVARRLGVRPAARGGHRHSGLSLERLARVVGRQQGPVNTDAVLQALKAEPGENELAMGQASAPVSRGYLSILLSRAVAQGYLVRTARGMYHRAP